MTRRLPRFVLFLYLALGGTLMAVGCGCTPDRKAEARTHAAAADAHLSTIDSAATDADGELQGMEEAGRRVQDDPATSADAKAFAAWVVDAAGRAREHVARILATLPKASARVAALKETADKAIDERDDPARRKLVILAIVGGVIVAAGLALYWTQKTEHALSIAVFGGLIVCVAWTMGWMLNHPWWTGGAVAAVFAGVIAYDQVRHPDDAWGSWWWAKKKGGGS